MAVKELITLRRDRPLLKSFTTSAFNGSPSPAEAALQLVKAFAVAPRVSASQWRVAVRGTVTLVPKADLLRAGGERGNREKGNCKPLTHCSQEMDFEILIKKKKLYVICVSYLHVQAPTSLLASKPGRLNALPAMLLDVCFII